MQTAQVTIRDFTFADIEDVTVLINQLGYNTSASELKNRLTMITAHPDYKTIVAVADGEIVGMAGLCKGIFYEMNGMYMRILAFVVKQSSRKQGIGKLLLNAAENWALEQNLKTVLLNSGNRDERADAHAFYKKMGFAVKSSGFVKHL